MSRGHLRQDRVKGVNIPGKVDIVHGDIVGGDKGLDEERLVEILEARGLLRTAETAGLERRTVIKLAERLKPEERLDFNQAITELQRAVQVALDVIARGERGTNDDAFVDAVLARVAEQTRIGDLDGGANTIDEGLAELEQTYRRQRVFLLEEGVKLDTLRRDAAAVARRVEKIVAVAADHPIDRMAWHPQFYERFAEFSADGQLRGINISSQIAAEMARRMLCSAQDNGERALALNLFGHGMLELGRRGVETNLGTNLIEEAVKSYRDAIKHQPRDAAPMDWAKYQSNLGNALAALAEREAGAGGFEDAIAAYSAALQERTRERVPVDWAKTQLNLGNALRQLGERKAGREYLLRAVRAFRAALQVFTPTQHPDFWATAQTSLGSALLCCGERESVTDRLNEAVAAFGAALLVRTRERARHGWAYVQNGLATALRELGQREHKPKLTEEAVAAYRAVLEVWTRDGAPDLWAGVQINLGHALRNLGESDIGTSRLQEAVEADRNALSQLTRERQGHRWAMAQNGLGSALLELGKREAVPAFLHEAVKAFEAALGVWTSEGDPACHHQAKSQLQTARLLLSGREDQTETISASRPARTRSRRKRAITGLKSGVGT